MPNESYVRADYTCPLCLGPKDRGLVLCWPCHRSEKRANDGCYSAFAERRIAARDDYLRKQRKPTEIDDGMGGRYRPGVIIALDD